MKTTWTRRAARVVAWAAVVALVMLQLGSAARAGGMPPDYGFNWAVIDHPGNAPYRVPEGFGGYFREMGAVPYTYRISKQEMTAVQWADFAQANWVIGDPWRVALYSYFDGILGGNLRPRTDIPLGNEYPVNFVNWYNAARYCNWLHNGKQITREAMEYGAYDLRGLSMFDDTDAPPARLPGAKFFLPTLDEWVKAGHYDPNRYGDGNDGYWLYPTTSDTAPISGPRGVGQTSAGYVDNADPFNSFRVGAYPATQSPWGLLDMSGCLAEWLETSRPDLNYANHHWEGTPGFSTGIVGDVDHIWWTGNYSSGVSELTLGFRIASSVPSPSIIVVGVGACAFGTSIKKRREPRTRT